MSLDCSPDMQYHCMSLSLLLENYSLQQQGEYTPHVTSLSPPDSPLLLYFVIRAKRIYSQVAPSLDSRDRTAPENGKPPQLRPLASSS